VVVSDRGDTGLLWQAAANFNFRIAGGFLSLSITPGTGLPAPIELLSRPTSRADGEALTYLRQDKIGAILVEQSLAPRWAVATFRKLGLHGQAVGGVILYELTRPRRPARPAAVAR
jgi:hypothetical protein